MNKENVLFAIIGLLIGLILGFTVTNYINRSGFGQTTATPAVVQTAATKPGLSPAGQSQLPQINNQVVRDQTQTGGMLPQVQETLDRAKNEPNNFAAQMAAGDMYLRIKNSAQALEYYNRASQLNPTDYAAMVQLGNKFFDANQFEKAEKWYLAALAKNPDDVNVRTDLGLTFFLREPKDIDRAIKEYRVSLEKNPNHELTLQNLAVALREKGDAQAFQDTLVRLEKVNPANPVLKLKTENSSLNN